MNPPGAKNLPPDVRRQFARAHLQGFNHQPIVDNHRQQKQEALQKIMAEISKLREDLQKMQEMNQQWFNEAEAYDAMPMLHERNDALKDHVQTLTKENEGLKEPIKPLRSDLAKAHEQRIALIESIDQMRRKLKSADAKRYRDQDTVETLCRYANNNDVKTPKSNRHGSF